MSARTGRGSGALARIIRRAIFFLVAVSRGDRLLSRSSANRHGDDTERFAREVGSLPNALPRDPSAVHVLANRTTPLGEKAGGLSSDHQARTKSSSAQRSREPRVYFLFLAVDRISNFDVWTAYFHTATHADSYRAYVHCKMDSCKTQVEGSPIRHVPTVDSSYCTDLVSPMNALVDHALRQDSGDSHPADKFVFLSDSTLPAKPLSLVLATLTARTGSDFCIFPTSQWAELDSSDGPMIFPKSLQWVTLSRAHAEKSVRLWADAFRLDSVTRLRMDQLETARKKKNYGCLDEFWYFLALYGPIQHLNWDVAQHVDIGDITRGSLDVTSEGDGSGWQGECDTFVLWSSFLKAGRSNPFERLFSDLDPGSVPHTGSSARPGWWDSLTEAGMKAFRSSEFLFVRKFVDQPELKNSSLTFPQAYSRIIFS